MTEERKNKILDLSELAPQRPIVRFRDGSEHEMRTSEELSLNEQSEIQRLSKEVAEGNCQDIIGYAKKILKLIMVEITDEELDKLTDGEKTRIIHFFAQRVSEDIEEPEETQTGAQ